MKKALTGILLLVFTTSMFVQCDKDDFSFEPEDRIYIADSSFFQALLEKGIDANGDGYISFKEAEAVSVLNVDNREISFLAGIERFTNLDTLSCGRNSLLRLDVSKIPGLVYLDCSGNQLTALDVSDNVLLENLLCSGNQLTS